jgi:sugar/nucleoside kinase (ribokinase family)
MDNQGRRISIFITNSNPVLNLPQQYLEQQLSIHDIIVYNIISYCRPWAKMVAASGKTVWTDLHDYDGNNEYHQPFIDAAQYIHLSSDQLTNYRSIMQNFIERGKKLVICTHGKEGATLLSPTEGWIEQPALQVPVADSNGAGDNFCRILIRVGTSEKLESLYVCGCQSCGLMFTVERNSINCT